MEDKTTESIYAVLAIQILTLLFQFINGLIAQIHKNKLDQIHAINEGQNKKLEEIHKQSSQNGSTHI